MFFLILKRRLYFVISSLLPILLILVMGVLLVFASPVQTALSRTDLAQRWQGIGPGGPDIHHQQNNQSLQAVANGSGNATFTGAGQGNSGNLGVNNGLNQVNASNLGNQVSGQRKNVGLQENDQAFQQTNNNSHNATLIGTNQGNSGNQGINRGLNQDNSGNNGNQVNNQGNVIGVQVNNQGSQVNNNGNLILHQINYIDLLPAIHLHVALVPRPQLSLGLGGN